MFQTNEILLILKIKFNFICKSQAKKCQGKKDKIFAGFDKWDENENESRI